MMSFIDFNGKIIIIY